MPPRCHPLTPGPGLGWAVPGSSGWAWTQHGGAEPTPPAWIAGSRQGLGSGQLPPQVRTAGTLPVPPAPAAEASGDPVLGLTGVHPDSGPALACLSSSKWGSSEQSECPLCLPRSGPHSCAPEPGTPAPLGAKPRPLDHANPPPGEAGTSSQHPHPSSWVCRASRKRGSGAAGWCGLSPSPRPRLHSQRARACHPGNRLSPSSRPPSSGWPLRPDGTVPPPSLA